MSLQPVPVTLVTGFLGAGKTTLVNAMLRDADGLRLAVLVNDFGAVNIDAELIEGATQDVIALKNGCICCSMTAGLLSAVRDVLRRPEPPDAIVIEGSGVSDPGEVARALADPDLQRYAPLDGIVTLVDASATLTLDAEARALVHRQIAAADLVLLNKVDLVEATTLATLEKRIADWAPEARLIRCAQAQVPQAVLLGLARQEIGAWAPPLPSAADRFESIAITREAPIPTQSLHDLLSRLPDRVYRVKGVLCLSERPELRCILQATARRASLTFAAPWADRPAQSRIVFIAAKGTLDRAWIESHLGREEAVSAAKERSGAE